MRTKNLALLTAALLLATLTGCGSSRTSDGSTTSPGTTVQAGTEGSDSCKVCHSAIVAEGFNGSAHDVTAAGCEGCHGGGQFHKGVGPIPVPAPEMAQCTACHTVNTHEDDPATTDVEGYVVEVCNDCHGQTHNPVRAINREWAQSAHGGFIAAVKAIDPSGAVTKAEAPGWVYYDWDNSTGNPRGTQFTSGPRVGQANEDRKGCQRCHTATGVANFLNSPLAYDPANNDFSHLEGWSTDKSSPQQEMLYCWGCHSDAGTGALRNPGALTISFSNGASADFSDVAASNVCMACHTGREIGDSIKGVTGSFTDRAFINSHYLSAGGQVFNESGYEYAGQTYNEFGFHKNVGMPGMFNTGESGPCVACHMSVDKGHTFNFLTKDASGTITANNSQICANCHANVTPVALESSKSEFHAALEELRVALEAKGIFFGEAHPYFYTAPYVAGGTNAAFRNWDGVYPGFGKDVMGAAFNFNLLAHDHGAYAHNKGYSLKLIADSIDFLNDGLVDGDASQASVLLVRPLSFGSEGFAPIHSDVLNQASDVSCSACHDSAPHYGGSRTAPSSAQWVSTGVTCADCHASGNVAANPQIIASYADSRHGDVNGPGWAYSNAYSSSCQRCHTTRGFLANLSGTAAVIAGATDPLEVLTCNGCHTSVVTGDLRTAPAFAATWSANSITATANYPDAGSSNLCIRCHSARRAGVNITATATNNTHYLPAAAVVFGGTANMVTIATVPAATGGGYEFAGQVYTNASAHKGMTSPCVTCHMSGTAGHSWNAVATDPLTGDITAINSTSCADCHGAAMTPAAMNAAKSAFADALDDLEAELNRRNIYFNPATGGFHSDAAFTSAAINNAYYAAQAAVAPVISTRDLQGAAFNFWLFKYKGADPAGYVHNPAYALKLVNDSTDLLNDAVINGNF